MTYNTLLGSSNFTFLPLWPAMAIGALVVGAKISYDYYQKNKINKILSASQSIPYEDQIHYQLKTDIINRKCLLTVFETAPSFIIYPTLKKVFLEELKYFKDIKCITYVSLYPISGYHIVLNYSNQGFFTTREDFKGDIISDILFEHNYLWEFHDCIEKGVMKNILKQKEELVCAGSEDGTVLSIKPAFCYNNQIHSVKTIEDQYKINFFCNLKSLIEKYPNKEYSFSEKLVFESHQFIYVTFLHHPILKKMLTTFNLLQKFAKKVKQVYSVTKEIEKQTKSLIKTQHTTPEFSIEMENKFLDAIILGIIDNV